MALPVEHIVSCLERKAERFGVPVCRFQLLLRSACGNDAELAGSRNERAGFEPVDSIDFLLCQNELLARQIQNLPADHAVFSRARG